MSEWLKEHAWKACVRLRVPWVRIPLSPHLIYTHPEGWQSLAECTGLENQQGFIPFGGSNPSPSANIRIAYISTGIFRGSLHKYAIPSVYFSSWLIVPFFISFLGSVIKSKKFLCLFSKLFCIQSHK